MTLLAERGGDVLVVMADESLPEALTSQDHASPAAAILRARPTDHAALEVLDRTALAWLADLRQTPAAPTTSERSVNNQSPSGAFLRLVASVMRPRSIRHGQSPSRVDVTAGPSPRWSVESRRPARELDTSRTPTPAISSLPTTTRIRRCPPSHSWCPTGRPCCSDRSRDRPAGDNVPCLRGRGQGRFPVRSSPGRGRREVPAVVGIRTWPDCRHVRRDVGPQERAPPASASSSAAASCASTRTPFRSGRS